MPDLAASMKAVLDEFVGEAVDYNIDTTKESAATERAAQTGYWGPWLDVLPA